MVSLWLNPTPIGPVRQLTVYVASPVFPDGNPKLAAMDALGTFPEEERIAAPLPDRGRPAKVHWRLNLVAILQFAEGLPGRQVADGVRTRIDWKNALGLEATDPGIDYPVPCEFRHRNIAGGGIQIEPSEDRNQKISR